MMNFRLRDVTPADLDAVHALNRASVPHLNELSRSTMARFAEEAAYFRVAESGGTIIGFLIALTPDAAYDSPNFLKFVDWFADFVYVDRLAVAQSARRMGVARALYKDLEHRTQPMAARITCEVNLRPLNGDSLAFHRGLGFRQMGTQRTDGGSKTVALLMKPIPRASSAVQARKVA